MKKLEDIKSDCKYKIAEFILNILVKFYKDKPSVYECMSCNKIYDKPQECTCGSKKFIYNSRKYKIEDGSIVCGCGKGYLESDTHYDCDNGFSEDFKCSRCRNIISIFEYMEEEDYNFNADEMLRYLSQLDDDDEFDDDFDDEDIENSSRYRTNKIVRIRKVD